MKKRIFYFFLVVFYVSLQGIEKKYIAAGIASLGFGGLAYFQYIDIQNKLAELELTYNEMIRIYGKKVGKKYEVASDHSPQKPALNLYINQYEKIFLEEPPVLSDYTKKHGGFTQEDLEQGITFEKLKKDYNSINYYKYPILFSILSIGSLFTPFIYSLIRKK